MPRDSTEALARKAVQLHEAVAPVVQMADDKYIRELKAAKLDGSPESEREALELVRKIQVLGDIGAMLSRGKHNGNLLLEGEGNE